MLQILPGRECDIDLCASYAVAATQNAPLARSRSDGAVEVEDFPVVSPERLCPQTSMPQRPSPSSVKIRAATHPGNCLNTSEWNLVQAIRSELQDVMKSEMQALMTELKTWLRTEVQDRPSYARQPSLAQLVEEKFGKYESDEEGGEHRVIADGRSLCEEKQSLRVIHDQPSQHPPLVLAAFDAIKKGNYSKLQSFLEDGLDPNSHLEDFPFGKKTHTYISLMPAAVLVQDVEMVNLLAKYGADVNSEYSFLAGSTNMHWSGNALFACPAKGNIEMLDTLVSLRADVHEKSSNEATLVWQAAYFGKHSMLKELLHTYRIDCKHAAWSQDKVGVKYSPLHIAVITGHEHCAHMLIDAEADLNMRNEEHTSPLDDAIMQCQPGIVCKLVSRGAILVDAGALDSNHNHNSKVTRIPSQICVPTLQLLFDVNNPVVVRAAATGLQKQEDQVEALPINYVIDFLENSSKSKAEMMEALFRKRKLLFRGRNDEVLERKSAFLGKGIRALEKQHRFPSVVKSEYSFAHFQNLFKERKRLDDGMNRFLNELLPQELEPGACHWRGDRHATSVSTFECLLPNIDSDLRIMKAIQDSRPTDVIFRQMHCQAVIHAVWLKVRRLAQAEVVAHAAVLSLFIIASEQLRGLTRHTQSVPDENQSLPSVNTEDVDFTLKSLAIIGVPFWAFAFLRELLEVVAHWEYGWLLDYAMDQSNYLDVLRIVLDSGFLFHFFFYGSQGQELFGFRVLFSGCCFFKWTKIMFCLTPFGTFGLRVMPILFAARDVGPFVLIMLVYVAGVAHALAAMNLAQENYLWNFLNSFYFGTVAEYDKVPHFFNPPYDNSLHRWFTLALLAAGTFLVPITLMNIFIAALGASYDLGVENMEQLYQSRKAGSSFGLLAGKRVIRRFRRTDKEKTRLWYCCDCDQDDDDP